MRCHDSGQQDSVCRKSEDSTKTLLESISEVSKAARCTFNMQKLKVFLCTSKKC